MKPKLGSGARFAAIERKAAASGARNPAAVAAAAGIKKYGAGRMAAMAAKGRARRNPDPSVWAPGTLKNLTHEGVGEDLPEQGGVSGEPKGGFTAAGAPFSAGVGRNVSDPAEQQEQTAAPGPTAKAAGETFTPGTAKNVTEPGLRGDSPLPSTTRWAGPGSAETD